MTLFVLIFSLLATINVIINSQNFFQSKIINEIQILSIDSIVSEEKIKALLNYNTLSIPERSVIIFKPEDKKKLIYLATEHINNPNHLIARTIKDIIENDKPEFCILEGFDNSEGISSQRIISLSETNLSNNKFSENLYAALLCKKNNIPFIGGDIRESSYVAPFSKLGYCLEDIVFFLVAQQINFCNRDKILNKNNIKNYVDDLIKNHICVWVENDELNYNYEDFLKWHEKNMMKRFDVEKDFAWSFPTNKELMPNFSKDVSIYQKIALQVMYLRDSHILKTISDALNNYDKVFVIFGASHYQWQKQALEVLFNKPTSYNTLKY